MDKQTEYNMLLILGGKITSLSMVMPIVIGLIKKKYLNQSLRIFLSFLIIDLTIALLLQSFIWVVDNYTDFCLPILKAYNIEDTNFIAILAYLNNFALLGWYFTLITKSHKIRKSIMCTSIGLFVAVLINYLFIEGYNVYSSFNATASAIYCFMLPLIHCWTLFNTDTSVVLKKNAYFWIAIGLVLPNLIGLFLHFTGQKVYQTDFILYVKISIVKYIFVFISQILFAIGFYYARYTKYLPEKW